MGLKTQPTASFLRAINCIVRVAIDLPSPPILVVANWRYREILFNWISFAENAGLSNFLFVVPERRLAQKLQSRGYVALRAPMSFSKETLWWRLFIFEALASAGVDFLHCDADAVILKNPRPYLEALPESDFQFSQGTVHPENVARRLGFVVCMGFFRAKGTPAVRQVFREALELAKTGKTDQHSMNLLLEARISSWTGLNGVDIAPTHRGQRFSTFVSPLVGESADGLRVVLLPNRLFQRWIQPEEKNLYICHPLANQLPGTKGDALSALGLWAKTNSQLD